MNSGSLQTEFVLFFVQSFSFSLFLSEFSNSAVYLLFALGLRQHINSKFDDAKKPF